MFDIAEILETIDDVNDSLYENFTEDSNFDLDNFHHILSLEFTINNDMYMISYCGIPIWDSENDEREYVDTGEEFLYEPLEEFLIKKINEIISRFKKMEPIERRPR